MSGDTERHRSFFCVFFLFLFKNLTRKEFQTKEYPQFLFFQKRKTRKMWNTENRGGIYLLDFDKSLCKALTFILFYFEHNFILLDPVSSSYRTHLIKLWGSCSMVVILFVWLKAAGTENVRNNTAVGIKSTAIYSLLRRTQGEREKKKTNSLHFFFLFLSDALCSYNPLKMWQRQK